MRTCIRTLLLQTNRIINILGRYYANITAWNVYDMRNEMGNNINRQVIHKINSLFYGFSFTRRGEWWRSSSPFMAIVTVIIYEFFALDLSDYCWQQCGGRDCVTLSMNYFWPLNLTPPLTGLDFEMLETWHWKPLFSHCFTLRNGCQLESRNKFMLLVLHSALGNISKLLSLDNKCFLI